MKRKSLIAMFVLLMVGAIFVPEATAQEIAEEPSVVCNTCLSKRRPKIRTCLRIFGKFDDGKSGGFLATGNKTVCTKDVENECDSTLLTGCLSES